MVREAWRAGTIKPLAGRDTTTELIRVLGYPKFGLRDGEREDLLGDHLAYADLLVLARGFEIPIVTPGEARPLLSRRPTA